LTTAYYCPFDRLGRPLERWLVVLFAGRQTDLLKYGFLHNESQTGLRVLQHAGYLADSESKFRLVTIGRSTLEEKNLA
jgi:hypothetical protein